MDSAIGRQALRTMARIAALGMGLWFVYSGAEKLWISGTDVFIRHIDNYRIEFALGGWQVSVREAPWDVAAAYTVPWLEMLAGAVLAMGVWQRGALLVLAGLVAVFAFCIGWAWSHELKISCGCHGGDAPIRYWGKVAEFVLYYVLIALVWRFSGPRGDFSHER